MEQIVLIGKVTQSTPNMLELDYPSVTGIASIRLARTTVARFERITHDRVAILFRPDESERAKATYDSLIGDGAPLHVTDEHIAIVSAYENGEELDLYSTHDVDDDVPLWGSTNTVDAPVISLVAEDGEVEFVQGDGPFDAMLYSGGRQKKDALKWDFEPVRKPSFVMHEEGRDGSTVARVNNDKGEPVAYHIFNPLYADAKRPAGAYLGTFSSNYYPMPYRKGFGPVLDMAAERGWPAQVLAWNEGGKAAMYVDITSSMDYEAAANRLGPSFRGGLTKTGDYRIGFVIYNSLDGSSSYKVQAVAMRMQCSNGMVLGSAANILSKKHTVGSLGNFDFENLAARIMDVMELAAQEILVTEHMKNIDITRDTFERLMTICERKGLITKPTIKRDDAGDVSSISRGHMWRVLGQGWTHSAEPWVRVEEKDRGSLYHVYNVLTGALTHKPEWTDGKQTLKGSTLNFSTLNDRLQTVHEVLGGIARKEADGRPIEEQLANVPMFSEILY